MPWPGRIHMFEWTRSVFGAQNVPRKRKGRLDGTFPATGGGADGSNKGMAKMFLIVYPLTPTFGPRNEKD